LEKSFLGYQLLRQKYTWHLNMFLEVLIFLFPADDKISVFQLAFSAVGKRAFSKLPFFTVGLELLWWYEKV